MEIILATFTDSPTGRRFDGPIVARLTRGAKVSDSTEQAWVYLEAAHVVGQRHFRPHLQTHAHMLRLAWRTQNWPEFAGQMLRLALVPLGNLSGRLPLGNPGRSTVSAFKSLPVRSELADLIARASKS